MTADDVSAQLSRLQAREDIRDLVAAYSSAIQSRDLDAMAELFVPHARFGAAGEGPPALRALMRSSLEASLFAVILVANHTIYLEDEDHARGEVWALCFAQNADGPFIEQLIRYDDRYERHGGRWRFLHRKHRLWYGVERENSPLDQTAADWPVSQVGVGDLPLADERFRLWWDARRVSSGGTAE